MSIINVNLQNNYEVFTYVGFFKYVELDDGIDYQLQESSFEIVATFKAHSCYWKSSDVALFIMQQLCQNDKKAVTSNNSVTSKL